MTFPQNIWLATDRALTRMWVPWHQGQCWCHQSGGSQRTICKGSQLYPQAGGYEVSQLLCLKHFHSQLLLILYNECLRCDNSYNVAGVRASILQKHINRVFSWTFLLDILFYYSNSFLSLSLFFLCMPPPLTLSLPFFPPSRTGLRYTSYNAGTSSN